MADIKTGGAAFPLENVGTEFQPGMTLRDYFAGQALMGMMAADRRWDGGNADMAKASYSVADAMLSAREGGAK